MALITVEELETAMGTTFSDSELGKAEYLINGLSAYIESMSGIHFGVVTDQVERMRANPYGRIKFVKQPVSAVTLIHDYSTDSDLTDLNWFFDGIDELRGLYGYQVVDVTYSYGLAPPADVKFAATEAIKRGMYATDTNLKLKQVGDVVEQYQGMLPLTDQELDIFSSYGQNNWTIRLDPTPYPHSYFSYFPFDLTRSDAWDWEWWGG